MLGAATHKDFCAIQTAQSSSQKYLGLVLEWDPWSIIPWETERGCEQNYFPSCQGAHSGPKRSHDVNSITCTTQFMSLLPFPSLLTCKRNFLDEKQVQQAHQELQGCALRAAFSPAANDTISLHTQVFCLRYFLHSCNAPKAAAPSCQVPKIIQRALLGKHQHRAPPAQIFPGCL